MDKNLNTDLTEEHGFGFFTDYISWQMVIGLLSGFPGIRECLWHSLLSEKWLIRFYRVRHSIIRQERECPSTRKSQYIHNQNPRSISSILSKNESEKRPIRVPLFNPWFIFFDLCPCRRLGIQRRHGMTISYQ